MTIPTTTGWLPAGITQEPDRCWHLVPAAGGAFPAWFDPAELSHYGGEAEAIRDAERIAKRAAHRRKPALALVPDLLAVPCWLAKAECGHVYRGETSGPQHFETADEAFSAALEGTWWSVQGGRLVCPRGTECSGIGVV